MHSALCYPPVFTEVMELPVFSCAFVAGLIKLGVIIKYAVPLIVLILAGTVLIFIITFYFGRKLSRTFWFERTIFAWGWWTGTMAMDDYAMAYLPIAPIEILLITFAPILFVNGFGVWFSLVCISLSALILLLAWKMDW